MNKYSRNIMVATTGASLLLCAVLRGTFADSGHYNPKIPGGDPYHIYRFPRRSGKLIDSKIDFQGWSFAGRSEFPWLVDIRGNDSENFDEQEKWANGNLVSSKYVLTVCEAVAHFKNFDKGPYDNDPEFVKFKNYFMYITPKNPKYYKVLFSDDYTYKSVGNGLYTGTRLIRRFIPHPKCNTLEIDYQWGMVELKKAIYPAPPFTSYMPVKFDGPEGYNNEVRAYVKRKADLEANAPCTVGLWSRKSHTTIRNPQDEAVTKTYDNDKLLNYKVRYVVFPTEHDDCYNQIQSVYPKRMTIGTPKLDMDCMAVNTNETLGTVCDRDRGAPIVCNGVVRAVVVSGVLEPYCNLSQPMPFVVIQLKYAEAVFSESNRGAWDGQKFLEFWRNN